MLLMYRFIVWTLQIATFPDKVHDVYTFDASTNFDKARGKSTVLNNQLIACRNVVVAYNYAVYVLLDKTFYKQSICKYTGLYFMFFFN